MAYQKTYYTKRFILKNSVTGLPIDVSTYVLRSQFRLTAATPDPALLTITTASGGWAIVDGPNGIMEMRLTTTDFLSLPTGTLAFDVMRTEASPGPVRVFGGRIRVKQPVTR